MAWRPRVEDPDHRSLRKGARTALVMSASFLIGDRLLHNEQFAVLGAFTGAALLGIADFGGERYQRLQATAASLAAGAVLLAIGTAVSTSTAAATITMFVVTFSVGFSAVFSGYFAAASSAVIVFYVVATGLPGNLSVLPAREAGLALGGALSLIAVGWLWPSPTVTRSLQALGEVYRVLAAAVRGLVPEGILPRPDAACGPDTDEIDGRILAAERAIAESAWRPDGLSSPHRARMYLLQGARRMSVVIATLRAAPGTSRATVDPPEARLVETMASELDRCADSLAGRGGELPVPSRTEAAEAAFARVAEARFVSEVHEGAASPRLHDLAAGAFWLRQLGWGVVLAAVHLRVMMRAPADVSATVRCSDLVRTVSDGPSMAKWVRRARRNLTPRSIHLQNSIRLAAGLALARLVVGLFDLQNGFWVGFATLVVLKTSAAGTRATAVQAVVGTAIGFGVSSVLITTFGVDALVYSLVLPLVVFAAFYLPGTVSFVAGQACFTLVIVILFNLLKPAGWTVGLIRLEDVLIGAGIGLAAGLAIWPKGATPELRAALARLLSAGADFAESTVRVLVGPAPGHPAPDTDARDETSRRVAARALDVEDAFSQYLSEPHQRDAPVIAWSALVASAHQLWFGTSVVALVPVMAGPGGTAPGWSAHLDACAERVAGAYWNMARSLLGDHALVVDPPLPWTRTQGIDPVTELRGLELEVWLEGLAGTAAHLRPELAELTDQRTGFAASVGSSAGA